MSLATVQKKRRILPALFLIALVAGLVGYAIGANPQFTGSVAGPGQVGVITINPSPIVIQSVTMNWTQSSVTITLKNTGTTQVLENVTALFQNTAVSPATLVATLTAQRAIAGGTTLGILMFSSVSLVTATQIFITT